MRNIFDDADAGEERILIPAIVLVEIIYLAEKGRIPHTEVRNVIELLNANSDNSLIAPLDLGIAMSLERIDRDSVPDMPDRIIAATALRLNLPLLTRDTRISALEVLSVVW